MKPHNSLKDQEYYPRNGETVPEFIIRRIHRAYATKNHAYVGPDIQKLCDEYMQRNPDSIYVELESDLLKMYHKLKP